MKLFIKPGCPWCVDAERWLRGQGYAYEAIDVLSDSNAFREMLELSGQTLAPTLWIDGKVLPDFGVPELETFLSRHNIEP